MLSAFNLTRPAGVGKWRLRTVRGANLTPNLNRRDSMSAIADVTQAYRTWMCVVCGFIYNEAEGLPEEGIAPGTRWEDIPDTWTCPDCGVTKDDFEMVTV
jgi:rubredoxin